MTPQWELFRERIPQVVYNNPSPASNFASPPLPLVVLVQLLSLLFICIPSRYARRALQSFQALTAAILFADAVSSIHSTLILTPIILSPRQARQHEEPSFAHGHIWPGQCRTKA